MSQKANFMHPYTFTVVAFGLEEPIARMRANDWTGALRALTDFTLMLDPEIKVVLKDEIRALRKMRYEEDRMDQALIIETADLIYNALHEAGYFVAAKNIPPTKTTGLQSLADRMKKLQKDLAE